MERTYLCSVRNDGVTLVRGSTLDLPASVRINGEKISMTLLAQSDCYAIYEKGKAKLRFDFHSDCIQVTFSCDFDVPTAIDACVFFADGVALEGFDRAFTVQPRKNAGKNMDYYHRLPDVSANGYNAPALLNLSIGSAKTWVGFGLLDLPDSKQYRMESDRSILVECPGGHKVVTKYHAPEMLVTFPDDEWDAISVFREKLVKFRNCDVGFSPFSSLPSWWKDPLVCTYGSQLVEQRTGQAIDEAWVRKFVESAEKDWGIAHMNLIVDSSWQLPHALDPVCDTGRFPDMRAFCEDMHKRGHHVVLWCTPLFDKITNGFVTRAQTLNVLSKDRMQSPYFQKIPGCYAVDYTADNAREYLHQVCSVLFGSKSGEWNVDGVKLDFMGLIRDPEEAESYAHPERGLGIRELYLFMKMFSEEARRIKPDVIIDSTTGDPRFAGFLTHNRLHDTHAGVIEKEIRAKILALGCPQLLIDTDGALMYTHWMRNHYISAAIYAIPALYYVDKMHDFRGQEGYLLYTADEAQQKALLQKEKRWFGTLISMVKHRPDGYPVMDSYGNWRLLSENGETNAVSLRGDTVIYYPYGEKKIGYLFTLRDEAQILPLYGHKFSALSPETVFDHLAVDYARDQVVVRLKPGVLYTFRAEDDGTSVDRLFQESGIADDAEAIMDYVN